MTTWQLADHLREMFIHANRDNVEETIKDINEYMDQLLKDWKPL